jgi:DNA-binding transcriptional LysR family regulator
MDARQLEYFLAVADELNFTRAAERVFAAQSTVSAGIRSLESELGVAVFERDSQRVALTPVGAEMIATARATLESFERMRALADPAGGIRGALRVGIFTNLTSIGLPGIMGEYHARHPLVDLRLGPSPYGSTGFADDVRLGRVDVAFMGLPVSVSGLRNQVLTTSTFVAVLPADHPLAGAEQVSLAALVTEPFVDAGEGFGNRVSLDRAIADLGLSRRIATEVADLGEIPQFVAAHLGVAVMPELTVIPAEGAVVRPLVERIDWVLSMISRLRPSAAAAALLELLAERFETQ